MKKIITALTISVMSVLIFCTVGVGAATPPNTEADFEYPFQKALLEGVYECYQKGYFKNQISFDDYVSFSSIVNSDFTMLNAFQENEQEDDIALPNSMNRLKDSNVSCDQFFTGYNYYSYSASVGNDVFSGFLNMVLDAKSIYPPDAGANSSQEIKNFLTAMGYSPSGQNVESELEEKCIKVEYIGRPGSKAVGDIFYSGVCAVVDKDDNVLKFSRSFNDSVLKVGTQFDIKNDGTKVDITGPGPMVTLKLSDYGMWDDLVEKIREILGQNAEAKYYSVPDMLYWDINYKYCEVGYCIDIYPYGGSESSEEIWQFSRGGGNGASGDYSKAAESAISYFSLGEYNEYEDLVYGADEKMTFYETYFYNFYGVDLNNITSLMSEDYLIEVPTDQGALTMRKSQGYVSIYLRHHTAWSTVEGGDDYDSYKEYLIKGTPKANIDEKVYRIKDDGHFCAVGDSEDCKISYAELIQEYSEAVKSVILNKRDGYEQYCVEVAKKGLFQRSLEISKYMGRKQAAQDFIELINWLMASYKSGMFLSEDLFMGTPIGVPVTVDGYKTRFRDIYNQLKQSLDGTIIFDITVGDNELLIDVLYNALVSMLNETEANGLKITKWPGINSGQYDNSDGSVYKNIEDLKGLLQSDINSFEVWLSEVVDVRDATSVLINGSANMNGTIWEVNSATGLVQCIDLEGPNSILKPLEDKMREKFVLPKLDIDIANPYSANDSTNIVVKPNLEGEQKCYENSGSIGWLICPIIETISVFGETIWEDVEQNHMKIPTAAIFERDGGVRRAWGVIRDFANIVFVILFLVVIFSQLTGIGIDNYGIKKILPKLILVAILVNLSWIICELAVDLSNVLGVGLNSILTSAAPTVNYTMDMGNGPEAFAATAWITDIALAGGGIALMIWLAPALAVSMGLAVLGLIGSIVVAILVMYFILIIREAGIVIAVVLAPIAIVGYALPNTEKISKKWFGLFKALLVVFPLCGLVMGGGKLAGAVLASINTESTSIRIAAMIIQVVPFFLIPMLLKSSLALMGNIGARLSNVGKSLSRKGSGALKSGVKNSDRFKNWSQYQNNKAAVRRAKRVKSRYTDANGDKLKGLTRREEERLAQAQDVINADQQRRFRAHVGVFALDDGLAENRAQSTRDAQELKASQDEFAGNDQAKLREVARSTGQWVNRPGGQQRMSALIGAMEVNGMERDIFELLGNHNVSGMSGVMTTLAGSKNKVLRAYGKKGFDSVRGVGVGFRDFMTGTGPQSLRSYIGDKTASFLDGIDDKALAEIGRQDPSVISTDLLMSAATSLSSQDAINEVNTMLSHRNDIRITGNQLAGINKSTYDTIVERARDAIIRASDDIVKNNAQLINSMDGKVREEVDKLRVASGKSEMSAEYYPPKENNGVTPA